MNLCSCKELTDAIGWAAIHPIAYHNISWIDTMPVKGLNENKQTSFQYAYRSIVYRLLPGSPSKAKKLAGLAGACRFVWNAMLAQQNKAYEAYAKAKENEFKEKTKTPSVSFFSLGKRFKELRDNVDWLPEYSFAIVRYTLKYQADAWQGFFKHGKGRPKFHSRHGSTPSFTIPEAVKIKDGKLLVPKLGYVQIRGNNPYPDGVPVKAVVKKLAGKWYVTVCYKVELPELVDNGVATGIDRNCGQVATVSTSGNRELIHQPKVKRKTARLHRYQRKLARQQKGSNRRHRTKLKIQKAHRSIANTRRNANHQASRKIANHASTSVLEGLKIKNMTSSAKGTIENSGTNVKAKSGLNSSILGTGWGQLDQMLEYKCRRVIKVPAQYTSQRCNACGYTDKDNRKTQSKFKCMSCGHADHADLNAAANILASGIGASARRGAFSLETPKTREMDTKRPLHAGYSCI